MKALGEDNSKVQIIFLIASFRYEFQKATVTRNVGFQEWTIFIQYNQYWLNGSLLNGEQYSDM